MAKAVITLFLALFLSGCATLYNPATEKNELILIDTQTECMLGRNVNSELVKKTQTSRDWFLLERAKAVGTKISRVSDRLDVRYEFSVLEDNELNAVSLPGGFVYINKGLINILNDDELAFVLGHETAHIAARHAIKKIQANMGYQLITNIALLTVGKNINLNMARAIDTMYNLMELGYSRDDEYLADRLGVKYAFKAGFKPEAALSALNKIGGKDETASSLPRYLRTHPYIKDRINALKIVISGFASDRYGSESIYDK